MVKKVINHFGDWTNYPYSNWLYQQGIKPGRNIDRDQDGIVDWEDCDPYDYYKQGIWSSVKSVASKVASAAKSVASNVSSKVSNTVQSISSKIAPQQTITRTVSQQSYSTPTRSSSPTGSYSKPVPDVPEVRAPIGSIAPPSVRTVTKTVYVDRPIEVPIQQQLNQVRAMAGLDPNLVSGLSPAQLSQLKKNEMEQRRRAAMDRFHQLRKERKKVY